MPEREVRKIVTEHLRALNQGLLSLGSASRFEDYVRDIYIPVVMPVFADTTQDRYGSVIKTHLLPAFGLVCLRDIGPLEAQRYVSGMATSTLSFESKDKIRDTLSSILGSAVRYGYLVKNPVEGVRLPPDKKGRRIKPYITPQQFESLVET